MKRLAHEHGHDHAAAANCAGGKPTRRRFEYRQRTRDRTRCVDSDQPADVMLKRGDLVKGGVNDASCVLRRAIGDAGRVVLAHQSGAPSRRAGGSSRGGTRLPRGHPRPPGFSRCEAEAQAGHRRLHADAGRRGGEVQFRDALRTMGQASAAIGVGVQNVDLDDVRTIYEATSRS